MTDVVNWGVLGASNFARTDMAPAIHAARGARLVALATGSPDKAEGFSEFSPGLRIHADYDALLSDPEVEAVYIPLPNTLHVEWAIKAMTAGKHVLVEKPLAMSAAEFDPVIAARDQSGLLVAEAYMILHHPQMTRARDLLRDGAIGSLRHVEAAFSYNNADSPDNIRNLAQMGGGALPDIGVYICGAVRYITGEEPVSVSDARIERENGVDTYVRFLADFPSFGYFGMVSMRLAKRQRIVFHGTDGVMSLTCPFNANVFGEAQLVIERDTTSTVERWPGVNHYVLQVEAFGRTLREGADYACPLEFSRGTQTMIDMVYSAGDPA